MSVLKSVESDLSEIRKRDKDLAGSALAATAKQLARELDNRKNSATSKAMCSKALLETLDRLRAACPPAKEKDKVDELADRRARRRGAAAEG